MSTLAQLAEIQARLSKTAVVQPSNSKKTELTKTDEIQMAENADAQKEIPQTTTQEGSELSEKQAIKYVKDWVALDEDVDISERRAAEEMVRDLQEAANRTFSDIPRETLMAVVAKYAPDAPHEKKQNDGLPTQPSELDQLAASGVAVFDQNHWFVKRCTKCGNFKTECCGPVTYVSAIRHDEKTLTAFGRQALGLDPITPPAPPKTFEQVVQTWTQQPWWSSFRGAGELEGNGSLKFYVENILPEGTTLICGLPKEGKSFLALSIAKALTTGTALFGKVGYEVPEIVPVLYLAAESGDGALKLRCERFGITKDKSLFISRTLSQGPMLVLNDPNIERLVKAMRPVVILETLIRFNEGGDEDNATENRKLAESLFRLIAWGARAVVGIHHSRKDLNKANPSKESAVRGSGDGLAMVDAVWLVMQDEKLHQKGKGPNEVDVVGWGRDFSPQPMRLALTRKAPKDLPGTTVTFAPGIVSCIDTKGDLEWVDRKVAAQSAKSDEKTLEGLIERLITNDPSITKAKLLEETGLESDWQLRKPLKRLGYQKESGGKNGAGEWIKVKSDTVGEPSVGVGGPSVTN